MITKPFGKTWVGLKVIQLLLNKKPTLSVIIVVPTDALKEQWLKLVDSWGFGLNCKIFVINTIIKEEHTTDLLILDEEHRYASDTFKQVFEKVKYKLVLGLTATIERLDGKHEILKKYCPVVDTVTLLEATANGWVSPYKEYQVLLEVDDINIYKQFNKDFTSHFEFFQFKWDLAMKMVGPNAYKARIAYRDLLCPNGTKEEKSKVLKNIMYHSMGFMRAIQNRKAFINNHPKKLEITRKIIEQRPMSQIITFSNNIKMAESIGIGAVYSGKDSKKKGRITMDEVNSGNIKVLNTIQKCNEGISVNNLSVAIMLGIDSSKIKAVQRVK